ncbi:ATP-binding protein [Dongia deserti]|uniref:ATP-binding protein n=1 Tax=Dongia deserti TaxID=2268030 RepID=UPI000E659BB4|nr:ATP-binding protein [Dongia deserti]
MRDRSLAFAHVTRASNPAIVRSLVERHGGTIAIDSAIAEGTCITVRLPASLVTAAPCQSQQRTGVGG